MDALLAALQTAERNNSHGVLNYLRVCLGNLLIVALQDDDLDCAAQIINAGADVNFQQLHFKDELIETFVNFFKTHCTISLHHVLARFIETTFCHKCSDNSFQRFPFNITKMNIEYIEQHIQRRETPLSTSIHNCNVQATNLLLANGARIDVDCGSRMYKNSLMYERHQTPLMIVINEDHPNIITTFIQNGLNINAPEHIRTFEKCSDTCLLTLLKAGLYHKNISHTTAIAIAAGRYGGKVVPVQHHEKGVKTLKFLCRQTLRCTLLQTRKENLIFTTTQENLLLPRVLCNYIVCDALLSEQSDS